MRARRAFEPERSGLADAARHFGEIGGAESCAIKHKFPADLTLIEIKAAAAGDAPYRFDAVRSAIVELDLVAEVLMDADEGRGPKTQEADRIGYLPFAARSISA